MGSTIRTLEAAEPHLRLRIAVTLDARPQWQIAAAAKVNPAVLSYYVNGRAVSTKHQQPLSRALGIPLDVLFPSAQQSEVA